MQCLTLMTMQCLTLMTLATLGLIHIDGSRIIKSKPTESVGCPASPPCTCDGNSIACSSLGLTEIPPFSKAVNPWIQLDLSNNSIKHVRSRAFENITINMLQISHNQINSFAEDALVGSENILEFLFMQYNDMTELPPAIGMMRKMSSLSIHHNPIQTFNENILKNVSTCLTFLAFGSKELTVWPTAIKSLKLLNSLDVYAVSLETLPDYTFDGLEGSLNLFDIESTNLRQVPLSLNKLKNLQVIGFYNNPMLELSGIPVDAFKGLDSVDMLSIMNSTFNTLPNITQLTNIREIDVINTPMEFWDSANLPLQPIIRQVQLSGTSLRRVPEALNSIKSLQRIDISESKITYISENDFKGLEKLEMLNFWRSPIQNISDRAFSDNFSLNLLSLDDANLTSIPRAITNIPFLRSLSLDGNKIECTCVTMGWLKNFIGVSIFGVSGTCNNQRGMDINDYLRQELPKCPN